VKVRQLTPEDLPTLKAIRLRALQDSPEAYGSTYEGTVTRTDDEWRAWFDTATPFLAEGPAGEPLGLAATYRDAEEPAVAHLISMWVAPEARGAGIGDALVQQVVTFAVAHGAAAVRLDVVEGNASAIKLYERNGFTLTGHQIVRERDGATEFEMELRLSDN
jgi:ribosomal protein S18 acetylase RimI-like enzyme